MKTLQIDLNTSWMNKKERQAQLEPLQEQATQMIVAGGREDENGTRTFRRHNITTGRDNSIES
jgi:hypothetical protein